MKSRLDQIEARLQAIIEHSATILSWGAPAVPLAHRLVEAMQQNLKQSGENSSIAPDLYTVFLNRENYMFWKDNQELLASLAINLAESARENGIQFNSAPIIRVSSKSSLSAYEVEILVSDSKNVPDQTSAMELTPSKPCDPCPPNAFLIVNGVETFPLVTKVINIGRRENNHLVINDARISRNHAQLRAVKGHYVLFDLNSTGGTYVNGQRVFQQSLQAGDVISLAGVPLVYGEDQPHSSKGSLDDTGGTTAFHQDSETGE
jgi:FHA domain/Protein of unknown function (DUF3662)